MGRMDVGRMRYLEGEHFRVLLAVEMGMKNHEIVPLPLIAAVAGIHRGAVCRTLSDLSKTNLVCYERGKKYDGYRLTKLGYDYLALKALCSRGVVGSVGNQIGIGKESDVYVGGDPELNDLCLKFHRLGRTSFRKIKEKRDYHKRRKTAGWLYLSRLAAMKEFAFLKALSNANFPVPRAVDVCRHLVVMSLVEGHTLCHIDHLDNPGALYDRLMALIVKLARYGLIHGDFNEFNLMLIEDEKVIMIDFPQMVSMDHENAKYYFDRDVECVRTIFKRKFGYDSDEFPKYEEMKRKYNLDVDLEASGFTKAMAKDLNKAYDEGNFRAHVEKGDEEESEDDEGNEDEEEDEEEEEDWVEESEDDDIIEEKDEDEEEIEEETREGKKQGTLLGRSDRFSNWLSTATTQLDELVMEEDGECPLLVHPNEINRLEEIKRDREAYIAARAEADEEEGLGEGGETEIAGDAEEEARERKVKKVRIHTGTRSVTSTCSTIPPEEIKKRVALQAKKNRERQKLKVKGRQSAVTRGRKDNARTIGESSFDDF